MKLCDFKHFLSHILQHLSKEQKRIQILKSLTKQHRLQTETILMNEQSKQVRVTIDRLCDYCGKRLGNSALVRYPDNAELSHYSCCIKNK